MQIRPTIAYMISCTDSKTVRKLLFNYGYTLLRCMLIACLHIEKENKNSTWYNIIQQICTSTTSNLDGRTQTAIVRLLATRLLQRTLHLGYKLPYTVINLKNDGISSFGDMNLGQWQQNGNSQPNLTKG